MVDPAAIPPDLSRTDAKNARPFAGLSAIELAAKRGIGPMSPSGSDVWHGQAKPCVSCGELILRAEVVCLHCGQDLSPEMVEKMEAHAGPWYVHEHVKPFPGVTMERLIRQVQRGVLTPTTIVRGPSTHHQWRFAAETPVLSKHLGLCWRCQADVTFDDTYCHACNIHMDRPSEKRQPEPSPTPSSPTLSFSTPVAENRESELDRLNMALRSTPPAFEVTSDRKKGRRFPVTLVIAGIMVLSVLALILVIKLREQATPPPVRKMPAGVGMLLLNLETDSCSINHAILNTR